MKHPSFVKLPYKFERDPPPFEGQDIKYPESLVRYFLKNYTGPGDKVFDPFAGLGTTLFVSEAMKRVPYGVEYDRRRYEWVAGQLAHWTNLMHGDAAALHRFGFPKMDFCITSPPFMPQTDKWNPLYGGNPEKAGYDLYLKRMTSIFRQVAGMLKKNAYFAVQVDNIPGRVFTPLVRDIGNAAGKVMRPEGEVVIAWQNAKPDYPHTHCLLFKNTQQ